VIENDTSAQERATVIVKLYTQLRLVYATWFFRKWDVVVRSGLGWLRIGIGGGRL
jgi:hypothetical protein